MTKKCLSCGLTTELKGIIMPDCDCGKCDGWHHKSICKLCYFETCSCGLEMHDISECVIDDTCENHKKTMGLYHNWNDYDYNFKLKNIITVQQEGNA